MAASAVQPQSSDGAFESLVLLAADPAPPIAPVAPVAPAHTFSLRNRTAPAQPASAAGGVVANDRYRHRLHVVAVRRRRACAEAYRYDSLLLLFAL
jgi:hypothetical protein